MVTTVSRHRAGATARPLHPWLGADHRSERRKSWGGPACLRLNPRPSPYPAALFRMHNWTPPLPRPPFDSDTEKDTAPGAAAREATGRQSAPGAAPRGRGEGPTHLAQRGAEVGHGDGPHRRGRRGADVCQAPYRTCRRRRERSARGASNMYRTDLTPRTATRRRRRGHQALGRGAS